MKVLATIILAFFLGAMSVSLFHMSMNSMDMMAGMSDCPFMAHEEVICPMNLTEHIAAWQTLFQAVVPGTMFFLLVVGVAVLLVSIAPHLLLQKWRPLPEVSRRLRESTYSFSYRALQELFARGILHPKLF